MVRKNIDIPDKIKEKLSIQAIKKGTNLKNYIDNNRGTARLTDNQYLECDEIVNFEE